MSFRRQDYIVGISLVLGFLCGTYVAEYNYSHNPSTRQSTREVGLVGEVLDGGARAALEVATKRALVIYAYYETPEARRNLDFFLQYGIVERTEDGVAMEYVIVINHDGQPPQIPRLAGLPAFVAIINQPNSGSDMCAWHEVLGEFEKSNLLREYAYFILMNASVRGPFLPSYVNRDAWPDIFFRMLTNTVGLAGLSMSCEIRFHLQSMLMVTDAVSLKVLRERLHCPKDKRAAVFEGELHYAQDMLDAGLEIRAVASSFSGYAVSAENVAEAETVRRLNGCKDIHKFGELKESIHPLEMVFIKAQYPYLFGRAEAEIAHWTKMYAEYM